MIGDLGIRQYTIMTHHQLVLLVEIGTGKDEALRSNFGGMHFAASDAGHNEKYDTSGH